MQCSLVSYVSLIRLCFNFGFCPNCLNLFYNGNLFDRVILKGDFIVLDLDDFHNSVSSVFFSYFNFDSESVK